MVWRRGGEVSVGVSGGEVGASDKPCALAGSYISPVRPGVRPSPPEMSSSEKTGPPPPAAEAAPGRRSRHLSQSAKPRRNTLQALPPYSSGFGVRHLQAGLLFVSLVVAYLIRMSLTVAVVQMNSSENYKVELGSGQKALVLSSFFWGYGLLQVWFGSLGRRGHAVSLLAFGNIASGLLAILLPFAAAYLGFQGIIALRFFTGLVQGVNFPNSYTLISRWAIPQEKVAITCLVNSGSSVGTLIAVIVSGFIGFHFDWPTIFFVTGLTGIFWGIIMYLTGSESPEESNHISCDEREFIESSFLIHNGQAKGSKVDLEVPWKDLLTSWRVMALIACMWCNNWAGYTIATLTPSYISGVLRFDLQDNGLISALPQVLACTVGISISFLAPFVQRKTGLHEEFLRKMWNSIGSYGSSLGLLLLAYLPPNTILAVGLLIASTGIPILVLAGHCMAHLDLSPNFAGIIMSLANSISATASILGPLISTYLIKDTSDREQWQIVFLMSAMISSIGGTIYFIWGTTKKQPWDEGKRKRTNSQGEV